MKSLHLHPDIQGFCRSLKVRGEKQLFYTLDLLSLCNGGGAALSRRVLG